MREQNFKEPAILSQVFDIKYFYYDINKIKRVYGKWYIGAVKESANEIIHLIYQYDNSEDIIMKDKWIRSYSDKIMPHKSRTQNDGAIMYSGLKKYIDFWS